MFKNRPTYSSTRTQLPKADKYRRPTRLSCARCPAPWVYQPRLLLPDLGNLCSRWTDLQVGLGRALHRFPVAVRQNPPDAAAFAAYQARRLEQKLGTPAKIYFKYEGVSPAGSHKPNTAVPQAFYNKEAGIKKLSTETGAGQWGSSLAFAGSLFDIDVTVFQVRVSYDQKPYRRALMETYGARCIPSPSTETDSGRAILKEHPDSPGSLGIAISEAVEVAAKNSDVKYALGSVLNHVMLHQTIIGEEAIKQFELAGDDPDVVIACAGGGSNFAGLAFPFLGLQLRGGRTRRFIAVEPAACPSLTRGKFAYDFGDTSHLTPLVKMHTLGSTFIPPGFHAGGLRYHGMGPLVSHAYDLGLIEAKAYHQLACFEAGVLFARAEGIVPAPGIDTRRALRH